MSRTLFDQTLTPKKTNQKRRGTVFVSVALHAFGLAVLLALGVQAETPTINSKMVLELAPLPKMPQPPPPPQPKVMPTQPVTNPDAAPVRAPANITPEPPLPPRMTGVFDPNSVVPGAIGGGQDTVLGAPPAPPAPAPRPAPPAPPRRVGGDIQAPQRIVAAPPDYPQLARIAKIEGVVTLEATIDAQEQRPRRKGDRFDPATRQGRRRRGEQVEVHADAPQWRGDRGDHDSESGLLS